MDFIIFNSGSGAEETVDGVVILLVDERGREEAFVAVGCAEFEGVATDPVEIAGAGPGAEAETGVGVGEEDGAFEAVGC